MIKTYLHNRQLIRELRLADGQIDSLRAERDGLNARIKELENQLQQAKDNYADEKKKRLKANKKIRQQTEADLLVNALRALGVVPKSEPDFDPFKEQARLQRQYHDAGGQLARQMENTEQSLIGNLGSPFSGGAFR